MSVYCTFGCFDEDGSKDKEWGYPQPYGYRKSHIIPTREDSRAGYFDLGYIPGFITRDGSDSDDVEGIENIWPYLRVSLRGSHEEPDTIVMDVDQVVELHRELGWWIERVKREPR